MKISIITATYNSEKNIEQCIKSINNQTYKNIEHIIIDGFSTDNTLKIIEELSSREKFIKSEKDSGIYEALNKGIKYSTGDIIGFLHSDDLFYDSNVVMDIVNAFEMKDIDFIYGDGIYFDLQSNTKRVWKSNGGTITKVYKGWMPLHPTIFCKKKIYNELGMFDENLRISSDYDFILRLFRSKEYHSEYLNRMIVRMKIGGISTDYKNIYLKLKEDFIVMKRNGLNPFIAIPYKIFSKIRQFI